MRQEKRLCQEVLTIYVTCYVENIYNNLMSWKVKKWYEKCPLEVHPGGFTRVLTPVNTLSKTKKRGAL